MDYRKYLGTRETVVLPYFGGGRIDAAGRRLRVRDGGEREAGWYAVTIEGRDARLGEAAEAGDLSALPAVRGHYAGGYLFGAVYVRGLIRLRRAPSGAAAELESYRQR